MKSDHVTHSFEFRLWGIPVANRGRSGKCVLVDQRPRALNLGQEANLRFSNENTSVSCG